MPESVDLAPGPDGLGRTVRPGLDGRRWSARSPREGGVAEPGLAAGQNRGAAAPEPVATELTAGCERRIRADPDARA